MKAFNYLVSMTAALSLFFSCAKNPDQGSQTPGGDGNTPAGESVTVGIRIEGSGAQYAAEISHSVRVREYASIEVEVTPADATPKITYETDDITIARVSRNGTITGRGEGKTDIRVLADGVVKAVCHLTVLEYEAVVSDFELDVSQVEIPWASSQRVVVKRISPTGISVGDTRFDFSSSDEDIFTVENDSDGFGCKINGIKPGTGTLHVDVRDAQLDIPVTITKKQYSDFDVWRYDSPYNDMGPAAFRVWKLTVYYPTLIDVYVYDAVSGTRLSDGLNGKYTVTDISKETVRTSVWEDCISIIARGDGSSDEEGWGTVSLHYENDLVIADLDLETEFRGSCGMHGDMTIVENNPNSDNYGKDLCDKEQTISAKGSVKVTLGRKSGKELKGIYRMNGDREWVKLITTGLDIVRWDPRTLSLYATVSEGASSCTVLYQGQYGDIKNLIVNYKVK